MYELFKCLNNQKLNIKIKRNSKKKDVIFFQMTHEYFEIPATTKEHHFGTSLQANITKDPTRQYLSVCLKPDDLLHSLKIWFA